MRGRADHVGGRRRRERLPRGHRPADALLAQDGGVRRVPQPQARRLRRLLRRGPRRRGRAYRPTFRVRADYAVERLDGSGVPDVALLEATSIRSDRSAPTHRLRDTPPSWLELPPGLLAPAPKGGAAKRRRRPAGGAEGTEDLTEGHAQLEGSIDSKEVLSGPQLEAVAAWLGRACRRGLLPKAYAGAALAGSFTCEVDGMRCLAFVKLRSSFCLNLGREHLSNTVYLEIDGRSRLCYQKCFCRCDTVEGRLGRAADGRAVRCRDFRSAPVRADELQEALFPELRGVGNHFARPGLFERM